MKKLLFYICIISLAFTLVQCSEDDLDSKSVINEFNYPKNELDIWLDKNFIDPYNVEVMYRMNDLESNFEYTVVPADYQKSVEMSILLKHLCLDAYSEVVGRNFIANYFPKMIYFIGCPGYNSNGTVLLGTADSGLKIMLYNINNIDISNIDYIREKYLHVIYHEFTHILHQTIPYSTSFKDICGEYYVSEDWSSSDNDKYLQHGFVTKYSSKNSNEDFVELTAFYISEPQSYWDNIYAAAGEEGTLKIKEKLEIIKTYMIENWNLDLDKMRDVVARRTDEVSLLNFNL